MQVATQIRIGMLGEFSIEIRQAEIRIRSLERYPYLQTDQRRKPESPLDELSGGTHRCSQKAKFSGCLIAEVAGIAKQGISFSLAGACIAGKVY